MSSEHNLLEDNANNKTNKFGKKKKNRKKRWAESSKYDTIEVVLIWSFCTYIFNNTQIHIFLMKSSKAKTSNEWNIAAPNSTHNIISSSFSYYYYVFHIDNDNVKSL